MTTDLQTTFGVAGPPGPHPGAPGPNHPPTAAALNEMIARNKFLEGKSLLL